MPAPSDQPKLGSKHRVLLRVERFSRRHYRLVFLLALLAWSPGPGSARGSSSSRTSWP